MDNILKIKADRAKKMLQSTGKKISRDTWDASPLFVNATYSPEKNSVTIYPAFLLNSLMYSDKNTEVQNKAGIGTVIGHEIGHAFVC